MKDKIILVFFSFFIVFSCKKKKTDTFNLSYIKDNKNIILLFENKTNNDIVFLTPNTVEFESQKNKDYKNVFAVIKPNQSDKYYQKILDSLYTKTLRAKNMQFVIDFKSSNEGHSVFYLKKSSTLKIFYDLKINKLAIPSKYKQIYYPYEIGLKENYLERDYIGNFSKLDFGKAKFLLQPVIKDSLFIKISKKDIDYGFKD